MGKKRQVSSTSKPIGQLSTKWRRSPRPATRATAVVSLRKNILRRRNTSLRLCVSHTSSNLDSVQVDIADSQQPWVSTRHKSLMDSRERAAKRTLFPYLVHHLDPHYIMDDLFSRGGMSEQLTRELNNDDHRSHRSRTLLLQIMRKCPFDAFVDCLNNTQHAFVADKLLRQYHRLITNQNAFVPPIVIRVFDIAYCEYMYEVFSSYSDNDEIDKLENSVTIIFGKWETDYKYWEPSPEKKRIVRIVIEAKVAWLRYKFAAGKECKVETETDCFKSLTDHTDNSLNSLCMVLTQYVQVLMIKGNNNRIALDKFEGLDAFGLAHLYATNLLIDCRSYERSKKPQIKDKMKKYLDKMIDLASSLADVNGPEKEYISAFVRRCRVVKVLLYLGMTYRGKLLPGSVPGNDLESAKLELELISSEYEKLTKNWRMMFHVAQARSRQLEGNKEEALQQARLAEELCKQLKYRVEEKQHIGDLSESIRADIRLPN